MMQLTIALALVCFSQTVLCAPAVNHKGTAKNVDKQFPSDTLVLQLEEIPINQPILTHNVNEARKEDVGATDIGEPEVKRSERVDQEDEPVSDASDAEDNLRDLSGNMKAADQDVKAVLRTFFQNLKKHPEIVEDIIEREGAKLMNRPLVEEGANTGDNVVPVDITDFQQPSPQLIKSPKQVEKKTGGFPDYPRFIYKSPMRNMKERNELTSGSLNNKVSVTEPQHNNDVAAHDVAVNDGADVKAADLDLSNAIPVIQQPSTNHESEEEKVSELLSNPEEGGAADLAALQEAEDEYSQAHPFMNTLPLFPEQSENNQQSTDIIKPESETKMELQDSSDEEQAQSQDTEIANTNTGAEDTVKGDEQEVESDEKRSETSAESHEVKDVHDADDSWSETQVGEKSSKSLETLPHQMSGSEIAAETLNNPVESESSVTFRPYAYYYYYNEDGEKGEAGELDATEEGETGDSNEDELERISSEAGSKEEEEMEEDNETDDSKDSEEEAPEEDEQEEEKDEDEEAEVEEEEDDDESEDQTDDSEGNEGVVGEEEEETDSEEDETESESNESSNLEDNEDNADSKAVDKTNSKTVNVEETVIMPDPVNPGTPRLFKSKGLMLDKNEADLMSLHGDGQRQTANRPIAGQPM